MLLGEDVERQSTCELEVDVVAADILNRLEVGGKIKTTSCFKIKFNKLSHFVRSQCSAVNNFK